MDGGGAVRSAQLDIPLATNELIVHGLHTFPFTSPIQEARCQAMFEPVASPTLAATVTSLVEKHVCVFFPPSLAL